MSTAVKWFKSSYSGQEGGECVEVATRPEAVHVRDSKLTAGPELRLAPQAWSELTGWLRQD
ncbi:DUF397 domain-containing protein [Streptomyces sp. WAC06614]|uniref:DUF397 domain-containing protein n=1 Tax=Streptomyces sp. WAC06614 TaxID=2487416 RepID=UPI000F7B56FD|nr:DUF397 domain-containing protein [Streptomyces sp. WAC06614]RSS53540.1 DUF397 domain-containing protein [Streptomyces sp. WAC06614]